MNSRSLMPAAGEYLAYYGAYTKLAPEGDIVETLRRQHRECQALYAGITEAHAEFRPAAGEWSIKQVVGHLADTERIFSYRALVFARADAVALPGMEPDPYVVSGAFDARTLVDIVSEFSHLRAATIALFNGLPDDAWGRGGTASNAHVTVRALAWIIAGHELHHVQSLKDKYQV